MKCPGVGGLPSSTVAMSLLFLVSACAAEPQPENNVASSAQTLKAASGGATGSTSPSSGSATSSSATSNTGVAVRSTTGSAATSAAGSTATSAAGSAARSATSPAATSTAGSTATVAAGMDAGSQAVDASTPSTRLAVGTLSSQATVSPLTQATIAAPLAVQAAATSATPVCYGAPGLQPSAPWPTFGLCPMHRGQSPAIGPQTVSAAAWTQTLGTAALGPAAIAADGTIYVGSSTGLYARTSAGAAKWTNPLTPGIGTSTGPTIGADGTVYYVTTGTSSIVRAITPGTSTPSQKWASPSTVFGSAATSSPIPSADGTTVYATSRNGKLVALRNAVEGSSAAGTARWTFTTTSSSPITGTPAFGVDGTIYVGADNGLYGVNPSTGAQVTSKSYTTGTPVIRTTPAVGPDGTVYFGTDNLGLVAVKDGVLQWKYPASGTAPVIRSSPAVGGDGTIYFGTRTIASPSTAARLIALSPNGTLKWSFSAGGNVDATPAIGADGMVYVTADDKNFYGLRQSGTTTSVVSPPPIKFSLGTGTTAYVRSALSIARNGSVYAPAEDAKLRAFGPGICGASDTSCDGTDNNCNGSIDEGYVATATTCGVGACASTGTSSCVNGVVQANCTPGTPAASDTTCNNVDDNCNGTKDEGYVATATNCGVGACARTGTSSCVNGVVQANCTPGTPAASDTTCNNVDDNCNGTKDEGYVATATNCGVGACASTGTSSCVNGVVQANCTPGTPAASDTTCNNVDDNCNGTKDEGYAGTASNCGVGACARTGTSSCVNGAVQSNCTPGTPAANDLTCNNVDDNCNGTNDEGYVGTATSCGVGGCARSGTSSCVNGTVQSNCTSGTPAASDAICNGVDDNCNGTVDEGYVGASVACGVGACLRGGSTVCISGTVQSACTPGSPAASDTTCNGVDDNCNGSNDEGYVATATTCGSGACARTGATACVNGTVQDTCAAGTPAASDATCDGIDDNCNGTVDENYGQQSTSCGVGACARTGATSCVAGVVKDSCVAATPTTSADTTCDGVDDNCNGAIDEGCVPAAPVVPVLDGIAAVPRAAYSVARRLRSAYAGPALHVARVSDGADTAIGFTSFNTLDVAAIHAFCNTSDCYASYLNDQSGNGRDMNEQGTPSTRIKFYDGATGSVISVDGNPVLSVSEPGRRLVRYDGLGLSGNPALTIVLVGRYIPGSTSSDIATFRIGSDSGGTEAALGYLGNDEFVFTGGGDTSWFIPVNTSMHRMVYQHAAGASIGSSILYVNGIVALNHAHVNDSGPYVFVAGGDSAIGKHASNAGDAGGDTQTAIVWDSMLSASDLATLETGLAAGPVLPASGLICGAAHDKTCVPSQCVAAGQCPAGALDTITTIPAGAYSAALRLRSAYQGPALRLRRSDGVEANIGFDSSNVLDIATVSRFCGASNCYVSVLYDQAPTGRDLFQPTQGNQIKFYDGATGTVTSADGKPVLSVSVPGQRVLRYDALGISGNPDLTVAMVGRHGGNTGSTAAEIAPLIVGAANNGTEVGLGYQNADDYLVFSGGNLDWTVANNTVMHRTVFQHAAGDLISASTLTINGAAVSTGIHSNDANPFSIVNGGETLIGKHPTNIGDSGADIQTAVVWNAKLSATDLAALEAELASAGAATGCAVVQSCVSGDGCCPSACNQTNDSDCPFTGQGVACDLAAPACSNDLSCRTNLGDRFGLPASTAVCWDPECDNMASPLFACGSVTARCGLCPACTPQCQGKSCGYDGCYGTCGAVCSQGQLGVVSRVNPPAAPHALS
jgi:hypothetical protein